MYMARVVNASLQLLLLPNIVDSDLEAALSRGCVICESIRTHAKRLLPAGTLGILEEMSPELGPKATIMVDVVKVIMVSRCTSDRATKRFVVDIPSLSRRSRIIGGIRPLALWIV